ncbi:STAS domain-containing protein [Rugosimonospora acidiphila]|uniref:STAS domain-containing protein n=1 Tax=Rugosimonospora acidiphila TaxID=556531 RepID=UPI0031EFA8BB
MIQLVGDFDLSTAGELRQLLMKVAESEATATIVLDLSGLRFIDAHSIGLIVTAWAAAKCRGRQLQVDGLRGVPALIFGLLGLEPLLAYEAGSNEAGGDSVGRGGRAGGVAAGWGSGGGTNAAG